MIFTRLSAFRMSLMFPFPLVLLKRGPQASELTAASPKGCPSDPKTLVYHPTILLTKVAQEEAPQLSARAPAWQKASGLIPGIPSYGWEGILPETPESQ